MPATRNLIAYISNTDADGATAGNYPVIRTHPLGVPQFSPLLVVVRVTAQANVATPATVNVGFNPPNFDNIVSGKPIGGLVGMTELPLVANAAIVPEDVAIVCKVTVAAVP